MKIKETKKLIEVVLQLLKPSIVNVKKVNDKVLRIIVVSEKFNDIRMITRFKILADTLVEKANWVTENYMLIFEAWTKKEFENLKQRNEKSEF